MRKFIPLVLTAWLIGMRPVHASMVDVIDQATLVIYASIPQPSADVVAALVNARDRGVHIGVIVAPDYETPQKLLRGGIHVLKGEIETIPYLSVDAEIAFVDGKELHSSKIAIEYALEFFGRMLASPAPDQKGH